MVLLRLKLVPWGNLFILLQKKKIPGFNLIYVSPEKTQFMITANYYFYSHANWLKD